VPAAARSGAAYYAIMARRSTAGEATWRLEARALRDTTAAYDRPTPLSCASALQCGVIAACRRYLVAWRKVRFKGDEVLARCDEQGQLLADGGRVEIRYRPSDARAYRAGVRNLEPIVGEPVLADDAVAQLGPGQGKRARPTPGSPARSISAIDPAGTIVVYADGACSGNPGPSGVGIVLIDGAARRELSQYLGDGTNNIAELTAIELAASAIGPTTRPVRIHTDSQYSIGVLSKGWKAKANVELVARVRALLAQFSDLELRYVPGHSGVPLNERADALAVEAVQRRAPADWVWVTRPPVAGA
jgi:ribonuclease HI